MDLAERLRSVVLRRFGPQPDMDELIDDLVAAVMARDGSLRPPDDGSRRPDLPPRPPDGLD